MQRCEEIRQKFGVEVKKEKLRLFYKRNQVSWQSTVAKYYPHTHNLQLLECRRMEFAMKLQEYIFGEEPVIYLDQTTFRTDMVQKKAWFYKGQRFPVPLAKGKDKGFSFTVFGAVGHCIRGNGFFHEIHEATTAEAFSHFVVNLADQLGPLPAGVKPGLVLDNHNAGRGDREDLMRQHFVVERLPVYSSELNPIESCWSMLKGKCRRTFTQLLVQKQCTQKKFKEVVETEIESTDRDTYMNLCRAHYKDIERLLEKVSREYVYPLPADKLK